MLSVVLSACSTSKDDSGTDSDTKTTGASDAAYADTLFDTSFVHKINVVISDEDWKDLTGNPLKKTKYAVTVTIDGNTLENVSFATKGNTSLSQVADSDSDRYSFKLNFGKFEKGQTYQGLDKLNLNNIMSDATYMKDYLSYLIMRKAGVSAPLTSYAELSINGEVFGLYIAIEEVDDAFLQRNYGSSDGALYKPETEQLNNMNEKGQPQGGRERPDQQQNGGDRQDSDSDRPAPPDGGNMQPPTDENGSIRMPQMPGGQQNGQPQMPGDMQLPTDENGNIQMPELPDGQQPGGDGNGRPQMPGGMQGGPGGGTANGADLKYSDDNADSYSDIFDNAESDVTDEDKTELIAALKALSDGKDIDEHWNMDQIIRYFAAHNFVLNYDSYTGTMLHNYYLYEDGGKVTVFPWDYNLAFCGFGSAGDATSAVNTPIDSPLSGTDEDSRPLWKVIVSDEEYLSKYHQVFSKLISSFFESGECAEEIERVYEMIRPYVEADPSAFYTVDQFDTAVKTLKEFCALRAESIRKQLDGTLGSTADTQKKDDYADASSLTLSAMGSQGGRDGGRGGGPGGMTPPDKQSSTQNSAGEQPTVSASSG